MSPFFKGGLKRNSLFKDKLLIGLGWNISLDSSPLANRPQKEELLYFTIFPYSPKSLQKEFRAGWFILLGTLRVKGEERMKT